MRSIPATATGLNLDNAVQYGGIRRAANKNTTYMLHCTGDDGTYVREEAIVATNTNPEVRLKSADEFEITREAFNKVNIKVASAEVGVYSVAVNGNQFSYSSTDGSDSSIIEGLAGVIKDDGYTVTTTDNTLTIEDKTLSRSNVLILSDNLTTSSVTVIASFLTEDYGKITLPYGIVHEDGKQHYRIQCRDEFARTNIRQKERIRHRTETVLHCEVGIKVQYDDRIHCRRIAEQCRECGDRIRLRE